MPTLKGTDNTTEGNKRLAIVHDIVSFKRFTDDVNTMLSKLSNECSEGTDTSLNDQLQIHLHDLESINTMIIAKVNDITRNMNCKTAVHVFYTNKSAKDNKESRILKTQGIVTPEKRKIDFTDISADNQLALTTTCRVIVPYKK